jgi:predicted PhzF superfamily epimerase YddE/YHI9
MARPAVPCEAPAGLFAALGGTPREVLGARDLLVIYDSAAEIAALKPDLAALGKVDCWAAIVTARGENGIDFVSRFFAPAQGVPEDRVTGSAHCTLVPYWAKRLGSLTDHGWSFGEPINAALSAVPLKVRTPAKS